MVPKTTNTNKKDIAHLGLLSSVYRSIWALLYPASRTFSHGFAKINAWWRHQMEIFSALLAICAGNSPVTGEFPTQRPVTRIFDVYFDLRPKERLSKQWWGWWFETLSRSLWHHRNVSTCCHTHYVISTVQEPGLLRKIHVAIHVIYQRFSGKKESRLRLCNVVVQSI